MARHISRSEELFAASCAIIPGGVNSPVRAFRAVGGVPRFMERGAGSRLFDADGNSYIDYCLSWGPLILGHAHPQIVAALAAAAAVGVSFGTPTARELEIARLLVDIYPGLEMVRLVNSGTEATMSAIRLARAATRRSKIVKFIGNYHGHNDMLLVEAGSGVIHTGVPSSPGVPAAAARHTLAVHYNDLEAVQELFRLQGEEIAAVIVEPVAGNMGLVLPAPGFLSGLRNLTTRWGAMLIFDEVLCGFRLPRRFAAAEFEVEPDLVTLGKVIGGGLPVGAYGGKRQLMELMAPAGPVYQAGTLSGNPLAVTAGLTQIRLLEQNDAMHTLSGLAARLVEGLNGELARLQLPYRAQSIGSMWGLFFTEGSVTNYADAKKADTDRYARFFHGLLERGHYIAPSQFETGFISTAHTEADIDSTVAAAGQILAGV